MDVQTATPNTNQSTHAAFTPMEILEALRQFRRPIHIVESASTRRRGIVFDQIPPASSNEYRLLAFLPAMYPEWLGDRSFNETHSVRFPYVIGAMANGLTTTTMVKTAATSGFLGFFGAAGLNIQRLTTALDELQILDEHGLPWGSNLIHSPQEPQLEDAVVDLYLSRKVRRVSASAYMDLTPSIVRYAISGLKQLPNGQITRDNFVFAKISRPEVAARFLSPAPDQILNSLLSKGQITAQEAQLAKYVPIAEDITVESDSGGHTDNQALGALFPAVLVVRNRLIAQHGYSRPIRVGAAGGLGTPTAVASAFSLGAAYVLTGSVNQSCKESGLCQEGRELLSKAKLGDVSMAPAADMFEMGVEVQVLKRGTMFAQRAHLLREIYQRYNGIDEIDANSRSRIEKNCFRKSLDEAWNDTAAYWNKRDPKELDKANREPKHKMALLFRAYMGQASRWPLDGVSDRKLDYQIWCGPAMGSFNTWAQGSFLEPYEDRSVSQVGWNLLEGASVISRAYQVRSFGVPVPPESFNFSPRPLGV